MICILIIYTEGYDTNEKQGYQGIRLNNRFCTRCGALLRPDDTCPNCDAAANTNSGKEKLDVKGMSMGVLDCAKAFFSKEPHKAVDAVTGSFFMWIVFGVVNVIFAALGTSVIFSNGVDWAIHKVTGLDAQMLSNLISQDINTSGTGIFFFSLLTMAGCLAAFAGILYLFSMLEGKRLPLIKTFKAVTICFFPMTIMSFAAFLFSYIFFTVSVVFVLIGMLGSITMFNDYAKRTGCEMTFWGRVLCNAAQIVAAAMILGISVSV